MDAQKLLSAVVRTGERFGTEHLIAIVRGEPSDRVRQFGHDRLPTFGVGAERSKAEWRGVLRQLHAAGCLALEIENYGRWALTAQGRAVLRGERSFEMRPDTRPARAPRRGRRASGEVPTDAPLSAGDDALLAALKALRRRLATEANVPAYVVFPDRTLIELARARPKTRQAMQAIHGIGAVKLTKYGDTFLAAIAGAGDA